LALTANSNKTVNHWTIKWGDGSATQTVTGNPASVTHSYVTLASDHITASVTDTDGTYTAATAGVSVGPLFYTTHTGSGYTTGQAYVLTPTFTDPGGGSLTSYTVTWGDGTSANTYGSTITHFTHTYATDNGGTPYSETVVAATNLPTHYTATSSINVAPPTLSLTVPASTTQGSVYGVTAAVSSGQTAGSSYNFTINWGDGTSPENVTAAPGTFDYTYTEPGTYGVSINVTGDNGSSGSGANVTVALATPTVSVTDTDATITAGVSTNATDTFTNPGGDVLDNLTVAWGDGNTDAYYQDPGLTTHVYSHPGTYTLTDTFATDHATYTAAAVVHVIDGASLSLNFIPANEGLTSSVEANLIDPGGLQLTTCAVYWGDGSSDTYGLNPDHHGNFDHVYTMGATVTATVIATSPNGTYTASESGTIGIIAPNFGVEDAVDAAGGAPFPLAAYFDGDAIGNPTQNYPVANHPMTYNVTWGDGGTGTYSTSTFSHAYVYDSSPTPTNAYAYTVVAQNSEYTQMYSDWAYVEPALGGTISATGPGSGNEGTAITTTATFTDPAQGSTRSSQGAYEWKVYWGDGSVEALGEEPGQPPVISYAPTHSYAEPGSYEQTFVAYYLEDITESVVYKTVGVSVAEVTPTLTMSGNTTATVTGDTYIIAPTYTDSVGDHPPRNWTVTWGDGTSEEYDNAGTPAAFSHVYQTASTSGSTYHPTLSVTAFDNTVPITATASVIIAQPLLQVIQGDGTAMSHDSQHTMGAFIAVADDSAGGRFDTYGNPIPDSEQFSWSTADPDLVELTLSALPAAVGGTFSVSIPGGFVAWADPYKNQEVYSGATYAATSGHTFWLEALTISGQMAQNELDVSWAGSGGRAASNVDEAKFTAIDIVGPQTVAANGTYAYSIAGAIPSPMAAIPWVVAQGGTLLSETASGIDATIAWNSPPVGTPSGSGWIGELSFVTSDFKLPYREVFVAAP
jgi:hypothetical protein